MFAFCFCGFIGQIFFPISYNVSFFNGVQSYLSCNQYSSMWFRVHICSYQNNLLLLRPASRLGFQIHGLYLCRQVRPQLNEFPGYDIKKSESEAPVMWSTASLPSLPSPLWLGVVAHGRVLSIGQIEQMMRANKWLMVNCNLCSNIWNHFNTSGSFKNVIRKMCLKIIYIYLISSYK